MPEIENVNLEKVALDLGGDDGSSNSFGIQDTQLLSGNEFQNFLFKSAEDIKPVDKQESAKSETPTTPQQQKQEAKKFGQQPEQPESEEVNPKELLDNILFNKKEDPKTSTPNPNEDPADAPGSTDDNTYTSLARDLMRLGVFSKISDEETEENIGVKTPEDFLNRFSFEKKKGAIDILDNFLSQFGEDYRKMFDAVFVNGVKPNEYLQSFAKMEALGSVDLTQESNQERIVRAYYKSLKWDDTKIENRIGKLKDYGDLEDEAKTYHEVLVNKEKEVTEQLERTKLEEANKTKAREIEQKKSYHKILTDKLKATHLDGIPLNDKEAQATLDYLTEKKYKLESGELLSEFDKDLLALNRAENHELKVKLALLLRKKLDLNSVKKKSISEKSEELFKETVEKQKQQARTKPKEYKSFFS